MKMERLAGLEPAPKQWKCLMLPLHHRRVAGAGIEPLVRV